MVNNTIQFDALVKRFVDTGMRKISCGNFSPIVFTEYIHFVSEFTIHDKIYFEHFIDLIIESGGKVNIKRNPVWGNDTCVSYKITVELPYMS